MITSDILGKAIRNAVPPRAGYMVALPLLLDALENEYEMDRGPEPSQDTSGWETAKDEP